MSEKKVALILNHMSEEAAPGAEIDIWPALQARLQTNTLMPRKGSKIDTRITSSHRLRIAALITLSIALLVGLLLATPQGRAWAQTALRFFTPINSLPVLPTPQPAGLVEVTPGKIIPTLTRPVIITPAFAAHCGDMNNPKCTVDEISSLVNFPVKTIANLPEGISYIGATGGPDGVTLLFRTKDMTGVLMLTQGPDTKNVADPWKVGSNATVETVTIGTNSGEYIKGSWNSAPGDALSTWDPNLPHQVLRWKENNVIITITWDGIVDLPTIRLDKTGLVLLANELSAKTAPQSDAVNLKSAKEAGKLVGFVVIEPTWLPEGYTFDSASTLMASNTVCLHYRGPNNTPIDIAESVSTPLPALTDLFPIDPTNGRVMTTESMTIGGALEGKGVYATGRLDARNHCGQLVDNKVLQVKTGQMALSIYSPDYSDYAPTHMEMVKIAESITGVATIPLEQLDPERLHSVVDAEKLAGFHLLQPTKLPEGKTFAFAVYTQENGQRIVKLIYNGDKGTFAIWQTSNPTDTLSSIYAANPVEFDKATVKGHPALISQGFYNNKEWMKLADGGDGAVRVAWFENGILYQIWGFNELPTKEWLDIAESMK